MIEVITPDWPAPDHVRACTTLRNGGVSEAPFHTFNLASHVGDLEKHVNINREILKKSLQLPDEPLWLEQTHSTIVLSASIGNDRKADAVFTNQPGQVCVVMTADCLPILLCDRRGSHVAAIHAGWRGLAHGIIEETLRALSLPPGEILAWLGPAIGPAVYEVGEEVRDIFLKQNPAMDAAFTRSEPQGGYFCDLYQLARLRLQKMGVSAIHGGEYCTASDPARFFSYRRDGAETGRMASLIWMT